MRFKIDLHSDQLPGVYNNFVGITGIDPWLRRCEEIAHQVAQNPLLGDHVADRHGLELEFARLTEDIRANGGRLPQTFDTAGRYDLYAFMAGVTRVYERLSEQGQRRLKGMLLDGLQKPTGLLPLAIELTTATHLRSQGFNVIFQDLEGKGRADLLAKRGSVCLEVECCLVSGDIGRAVHRKDAVALGWLVVQELDNVIRSATDGLLVLLRVRGRLVSNSDVQHQLVDDILRGILSGQSEFDGRLCSVSVWTFSVADSPFRKLQEEGYDRSDLNDFVSKLIGRRNSEIMFSFTPKKRAFALVIESDRPDRVLKGIERQVSDKGKVQFSKQFPGVLVARLHDLSSEQLLDLANAETAARGNGLQWVATEFFKGESRAHMMGLAFLADARLRITTSRLGQVQTTSHQATGPAYIFHSKTHPAVGNPDFRVFREWQS